MKPLPAALLTDEDYEIWCRVVLGHMPLLRSSRAADRRDADLMMEWRFTRHRNPGPGYGFLKQRCYLGPLQSYYAGEMLWAGGSLYGISSCA